MRFVRSAAAAAVLAITAPAGAGEPVPPVIMDRAAIEGRLFAEREPVVTRHDNERGPFVTEDVETYLSDDRRFNVGMYRSGPNRFQIAEPYGVDEFMLFVEGGVTLTSADGSVLEVGPGDAVLVPETWTGVW